MPVTKIDLGEEDSFVEVQFEGETVELELDSTFSKLYDFVQTLKMKTEEEKGEAMLAKVQEMVSNIRTVGKAAQFVNAITATYKVKKKLGIGPPASPASTSSAPSA